MARRKKSDETAPEAQVAELTRQLDEALSRQRATAEILRAIASAPGEAHRVLQTIMDTTARLFGCAGVHVRLLEGDQLRLAASSGDTSRAIVERFPEISVERDSPQGAAVLEARQFHVEDVNRPDSPFDRWYGLQIAREAGIRTVASTPLMREGRVIGVLTTERDEHRPFSEYELAQLVNFADQAVIAIENARLLSELRESLENQTASANILRTIAASPADSGGALDAIAETTIRLFGAAGATLHTHNDGKLRMAGSAGPAAAFIRATVGAEILVHPETLPGNVLLEKRPLHIPDLDNVDPAIGEWPGFAPMRTAGIRTVIGIPLMREGEAIGTLIVQRGDLKPFTEREIAQLANFADQAVIAIENARLLRELRESLENQTATAEVLSTIAASPAEAGKALDTIAQVTADLFNAAGAVIRIVEGDYLRVGGSSGKAGERLRADLGEEIPVTEDTLPGATVLRRSQIHIPDVDHVDPAVAHWPGIASQRATGTRAVVATPLMRGGQAIGALMIQRGEPQPFTDKELAQLRNFADQAVIAIENARLLTELRNSLDRQTASAEVLQIISSSPGVLKPVFDAMLENALRICDAQQGQLIRCDGDHFTTWADINVPTAFAEFAKGRFQAGPETGLSRARSAKKTVHIHDLKAEPIYQQGDAVRRAAVEKGKARTALFVPLLKGDDVIGIFVIFRYDVRPFEEEQIQQVENFADQAVIAIENARLLNELRESLDRQTATTEVLQVISSSPGELQPVFETMLEKSVRLCEAISGAVFRVDGDMFVRVAEVGQSVAGSVPVERRNPQGAPPARMLETKKTVHVPDLKEILSNPPVNAPAQAAYERGVRSLAWIPMVKDGAVVAAFVLNRDEVGGFTDAQLGLVENFADQAAIAIENARLLDELNARNRDLAESLDQQTASADILRAIASAPEDAEDVLQTIANTAHRLFGGHHCAIGRLEGEVFRHAAVAGDEREMLVDQAVRMRIGPNSTWGRAVLEKRIIHVPDFKEVASTISESPGHGMRNVGTLAAAPLLREGEAIGAIICVRAEVRPFTDKELALLESFADQAVIAIENTRLLTELRARTDELAQRQAELRVTLDNMGDGVVMFDGEQRLAAWNRNLQEILDIPDEIFAERKTYRDWMAYLIERGEFGAVEFETEWPRYAEMIKAERRVERTRPDGRVLEIRVNPVPGGGFVIIYSDVTERRRAEDEVRAARDEAEQALGELQAAQASLVQAEKMASLGQLTAGIAHEIKNPLNFVNNFASLSVELLDELKELTAPAMQHLDETARGEVDELMEMLTGNLDKVAEHGKRADGIVKSMLAHSRGSSGDRQVVNLNELLDESLNLAYHGARAQDQNFNITMERQFDPSLAPIEVVPQDLTRVFLNLFGNGFYAANKRRGETDDAAFQPTLKVTTEEHGSDVVIRIRDNGVGIPPEMRQKLFEPFFTTKPTGEGTGLGLSISYEIVTKLHGGTIDVESEPGAFTEFRISLPKRAGNSARMND